MSLPLPDLTFYRLPDAQPAAATVQSLLDAIYNTLTCSVDYRGNAIPATHLWTWQTASTNVGQTNAVYCTAVPTGSGITTQFSVLIAGTGSSVTPLSMATPDTHSVSTPNVAVIRNPGPYLNWTGSNPMTTGDELGLWRFSNSAANLTTTVVRSYISQESVFVRVIQTGTTQYWFYAGAGITPYTSNADGTTNTAERDDRILCLYTTNTPGLTSTFIADNTFNAHNGTNSQNHAGCIIPFSYPQIVTTNNPWRNGAAATKGEKDLNGNWVLSEMPVAKLAAPLYRIGLLRNIYGLGLNLVNASNTIRSGSTDLYHILSYNTASSSQSMVLKAAP